MPLADAVWHPLRRCASARGLVSALRRHARRGTIPSRGRAGARGRDEGHTHTAVGHSREPHRGAVWPSYAWRRLSRIPAGVVRRRSSKGTAAPPTRRGSSTSSTARPHSCRSARGSSTHTDDNIADLAISISCASSAATLPLRRRSSLPSHRSSARLPRSSRDASGRRARPFSHRYQLGGACGSCDRKAFGAPARPSNFAAAARSARRGKILHGYRRSFPGRYILPCSYLSIYLPRSVRTLLRSVPKK